MADKTNCVDKDGNSHFGEYGWLDGYQGSIGNCRCGLKARSGACKDVDACIDQAHQNIKDKKTNVVTYNIENMQAGEAKKRAEIKEDEAKEVARREQEKKDLEERKRKEEALKEGKIICGGCKEAIDIKETKEVSNGVIKCPKCEKLINGQTGEIVVGAKEEPKKEEEKKEEKKEEPKAPEKKEEKKDEPKQSEVAKPDPAVKEDKKEEVKKEEEKK